MPERNSSSSEVARTPAADAKTQFSVTGINTAAEQQPPATAQFRLVMISFLAAGIGLLDGVIAFLLYGLLALFTIIAFIGRFSLTFLSLRYEVPDLLLSLLLL